MTKVALNSVEWPAGLHSDGKLWRAAETAALEDDKDNIPTSCPGTQNNGLWQKSKLGAPLSTEEVPSKPQLQGIYPCSQQLLRLYW